MIDIKILNQGFIITHQYPEERDMIMEFVHTSQDEIDHMRPKRKSDKGPIIKCTYANISKLEVTLPNSLLDPFLKNARYHRFEVQETNLCNYLVRSVEMKWRRKIVFRVDQVDTVGFLSEFKNEKHALVSSPAGSGKTLMTINHILELGVATMLAMKPSYLPQWLKVLYEMTDLTKDDVYMLTSKKAMLDMVELVEKQEFNYKIVLLSTKVWLFFNQIYNRRNTGIDAKVYPYPFTPSQLASYMGIGLTIIDEVHMELHNNHLFISTTNVKRVVGLSGTFISRDQFIMRMQNQMFPNVDSIRFDSAMRAPYISYLNISYHAKFRGMMESFRGMKTYSHIAYEQSILKNGDARDRYFAMIDRIFEVVFLKQRALLSDKEAKETKCLFYFASLEMIAKYHEHISECYPKEIVHQFTGKHAYHVILDTTIGISNKAKAGTALDIPGLITVIDTTNSNSLQLNVQTLNRLRKLDYKCPLSYAQLNNTVLDKHMRYQSQRITDLRKYIKHYFTMMFTFD